jgi:NPCBM/NEW2 domain/Bacterial Ig-like domain/FG-GAP-like repeat
VPAHGAGPSDLHGTRSQSWHFTVGSGKVETTYLSDLKWQWATNGFGPVEINASNGEQGARDGKTLTLNGATFAHGFGVNAPSDIVYEVSGCIRFRSDVGVDDEVGTKGSVVFEVFLDGTRVYDSGVMRGSTRTKSISLDLTGKSELHLTTTDGGDTTEFDHADWADTRLECLGTPAPGGVRRGARVRGSRVGAAFGSPATLAAGSNPHSVVAADLNGDGRSDLVDANAGSDSVTVFEGRGNGTFLPGKTFSVGPDTRPKSVAVADLNKDGKPDIVTANQDSSTVSVLEGNGGGAFGEPVQFKVCSRAHEVAVGDLNGDGNPDLAVACWNGNVIGVLLGDGHGTFRPVVDYGAGANPHSIVISDFNGDGRPDLAVADHGSAQVSILLGLGDGRFAKAVDYGVGNGPHSLRAGDLNGDGKIDLVTANDGSNSVSVLLGNGDGTFAPARSYATGLVPKSVAIGDLNGDGIPDVVAADTAGNGDGVTGHPGGNRVTVLLGSGSGSLRTPEAVLVGQTPFSVCLADLNGDGKLDLATADWDSNAVSVRLNRSAGSAPHLAVTSVSPWDGATGVAPSSDVTATFSQSLDRSTVRSSTVLLKHGLVRVAAHLSYDATTRTVTLDPDADLQANTTYIATVVVGAHGIRDISGGG